MFSDEDLRRWKEYIELRDERFTEYAKEKEVLDPPWSLNEFKALIVRLELAEQKDCNQYHCGHASCNAWRKSAGREEPK